MTEDNKPSFHQRRYLVDKRFQFKYTAIVVVISSVIFVALGYELYRKSLANTEILQIRNIDVRGLVEGQDRQILWLLGGVFGLQVASLLFLGILITHRIAGPMYRVQRYLEQAAEKGELGPLNRVRSRDEFKDFFDSLSNVISKFQAKSDGQKAKIGEIEKALAAARNDPAQIGRVSELLDQLKKTI